MTGERLLWYRVASHLQVPVTELQHRLTYTEFLEWIWFLNWEERRQTKQDIYLAQIAAEVRRGNVKRPRAVKNKDFFLQFMEPEQDAKKSKSIWLAALHVTPNDLL